MTPPRQWALPTDTITDGGGPLSCDSAFHSTEGLALESLFFQAYVSGGQDV
jgi:hypothetical protein